MAVVRFGREAWILDGRTDACARCLSLWRRHAWARAPQAADGHADGAPSPIHAAMIEAQERAVAASPPDGRVRRIDFATGAVTRHRLHRHPGCGAHGERREAEAGAEADAAREAAAMFAADAAHPRPPRARPLEEVARRAMPLLVDPRIGVVRLVERAAGEGLIAAAAAERPADAPTRIDHGYGRTGRGALDPIVAVLEAAERHAGTRDRRGRAFVSGAYAALRDRAADPGAFILPAPEQRGEPGFRGAAYAPDLPLEWVWGFSFRRDGPVLVPAQFAFYGHRGRDEAIAQETSSGCAVGGSMAEAALFGLLEAIERDAFLTTWHSGRAVRRCDPAALRDAEARALLARLRAEALEVELYDIGVGLPGAAVAARLLDPERRWGPAALHAAAAHLDGERAARAALFEAATMVGRAPADQAARNERRSAELLADPSLVLTMEDHGMQTWSGRGAAARRFRVAEREAAGLPAADPALDEGDALGLLRRCAERTLEQADDVIVVDLGFEPAGAAGLRLAKVLTPGLHAMTFGHANRRLSPARLARFAPPAAWRAEPHVFL